MRQNRFRGRELLPEGNLHIAAQIESRLVEESSGLYVVFENNEIVWPRLPHVEPFTVARHDFDREGPEDGMPQEVVALLESGWERLVWMPVEVAHGDLMQFTIRYAHELQHYRQLLGEESLSKVRNFLSKIRREGFAPTIKTEKDPVEFDADVVAFNIFEAIHGRVALQNYIESESADSVMRNFFYHVLPLRERFKAEYPSENI